MAVEVAIERRSSAGLTLLLIAGSWSAVCCAPSQTPPAMVRVPTETSLAATSTAAPDAPPPDDARGGRLYDNWRTERKLSESFAPDAPKTPELDGKGGPNGNGTLNDGAGRAIANTGHDYRLKNYFGWDLRGAEGVYGPPYQNKSYVLGRNLLTDTRSADEIQRWLAQGDEGVPAYGQVLDEKDLADLAAFVVKTRDAALAPFLAD